MKRMETAIGALALGVLTAGGLQAQEPERTLTIASWAPPSHVVNSEMWPEFIEQLEEITDGRVTARIVYGLAPPPAMGDLVLDGAADITYVFHGYNTGRFVTSQLIELPGYEGDGQAASVAYWRAWDRYLGDAGEQDEFKTLAMFTHGPAQFHSVDRVEDLSDIEDLKVRAPGGLGALVLEQLGGTGIQVPATKVYETLSSGAADAVTMNIDGRTSFKLDEVAPYMYQMPGGFYRGSFAALMNREVWESFSSETQAELDARFFGEPMSRLFGRIWDGGDEIAIQNTRDSGNSIIQASEADLQAFRPIIDTVTEKVLADIAERGVDSRAAQEMIIREMREDMSARSD